MAKQGNQENKKEERYFSKEAILQSQKYGAHGDLLFAILADDKVYTSMEIDNTIDEFQKGKVR
ncbi:hypothetical protein [Anaerotignum propionicum]|jgi:hypothetical protein|uniref:hypothetical protein n=1 Tax=Anaerotignum propionicum TaxID=28446 RepID=UPI00289FCA0B|nr:hypothetical protein [Anaerotignum propionicum]